jgi:periplasmic protein CpxP/Spy
MKIKILVCTLAAATVAGGCIAARALAADASAAAPARGRILQRLADRLNLTEDQRTQIRTVFGGEKNTLAPLLAQLHDARINLRAAIRASDATEASVRAASAKVAAVEADLAVERMRLFGKIVPILTGAQRQQLAAIQQRVDDFVDNAIGRIGSGLGN